MSNIKTVTLSGEELKIDKLGGKNTVITNRGSTTLYVSARPNVELDSDNVAAIPAGGAMNLHDTDGTVYLLGTGKVQLMGTNTDELPMSTLIASGNSGGGGSTGGVSQEYVDSADAITLSSAKKYTDGEITTVRNEVSDSATAAVASANEYTDGEIVKANAGAKAYTDAEAEKLSGEIAETLDSAKFYMDTAVSEVRSEIPVIPESLPITQYMGSTSVDLLWNKMAETSLPFGTSRSSAVFSFNKAYLDAYPTHSLDSIWSISATYLSETDVRFEIYTNILPVGANLSDFVLAWIKTDTEYKVELWIKSYRQYQDINVSVLNTHQVNTSGWIFMDSQPFAAPTEEYNLVNAVLNSIKIDCPDIQAELSDLKAYIGYTDSDIYGLEADFENNRFTRLAGAVGKNPGADFDSINAFGGRRRCCILSNGIVTAYYGDDNFDEDGWDESTNSFVQVMVEQPKFYYKVVPLKTEKIDGTEGYHLRKARYYISDTPKPGFKIHPAFIQNGIETDRIYLSAYEGCIKSEGSYLREDEQTADFNTDSLSSIINAKPASGTTQNLTRANARKLAQNRGAGWGITTIQTLSATQLLFAIEYATFNSQSAIGNSVTDTTEAVKTGNTSSLGNASGVGIDGSVSYRGEENLWGNVGSFVDGLNGIKEKYYIADHGFKDNLSTSPYEYSGFCKTLKNSGFISAFNYNKKYDWLFIPSEVNGNTSIPVGDSSYIAPNIDTIFTWGYSYLQYKLMAGIFAVSSNVAATWRSKDFGARLIYIPQEVTE